MLKPMANRVSVCHSTTGISCPFRDDARLLRAQALSLYGPAGIAVTRYLISEKLRGQARVLRTRLGEDAAALTIVNLLGGVEAVDTIDAVRQIEAAGANVYFAAVERRAEVVFARKDLPRVPEHWSRFNGRRSSINPGSPRSATDPAGAVLNYAYKLAEIEAGLAARRIGLSPSIGILHADVAGRPSFACDPMEAVRPLSVLTYSTCSVAPAQTRVHRGRPWGCALPGPDHTPTRRSHALLRGGARPSRRTRGRLARHIVPL